MKAPGFFWIITGIIVFITMCLFVKAGYTYSAAASTRRRVRRLVWVNIFIALFLTGRGRSLLEDYMPALAGKLLQLYGEHFVPFYQANILPIFEGSLAPFFDEWLAAWWPVNLFERFVLALSEPVALLVHIFSVLVMAELIFSVLVLVRSLIRWLEACGGKKAGADEAKAQEEPAEEQQTEGAAAGPKEEPVDESRRGFLKGLLTIPAAAAAAGVYGGFVEKDATVVREISVPVKNLPPELYGFRFAQLSDIHLGMFFSIEKLRELLERTAGLKAEALLLTGDVFDDKALNAEAAKVIDEFVPRFPKGIFFCYGNHEHIRGLRRITKLIAGTRLKLLNNCCLPVKRAERPLYFAGVDYPMHGHAFDMLADSYLDDALRKVPKDAVTVLLAHHPDFIDYGAARKVSVVLSGHTHGGQIGIFGIPLVPPVFKYMRGAYRVGDTFGYVHSGNGSWAPFRLGCPPEIACFILTEEG